jgi:hypothetical protein
VDDEREAVAVLAHRDDQVLLDEVIGNEFEVDLVGNARRTKIDILHAELVRERLGNLILFASTLLDEDFAEALAAGLGDGHGLVDLKPKAPLKKPLVLGPPKFVARATRGINPTNHDSTNPPGR